MPAGRHFHVPVSRGQAGGKVATVASAAAASATSAAAAAAVAVGATVRFTCPAAAVAESIGGIGNMVATATAVANGVSSRGLLSRAGTQPAAAAVTQSYEHGRVLPAARVQLPDIVQPVPAVVLSRVAVPRLRLDVRGRLWSAHRRAGLACPSLVPLKRRCTTAHAASAV